MFAYANDYEGALPRAGGPTTVWGPIRNWAAANRYEAYGLSADGSGGSATISSSFYLLVKSHRMPTKTFVCPEDAGTTEFSLGQVATPRRFKLRDGWDFGPAGESFRHCSYSYHMPYGPFALTTSRDPNMAVAADRNPFIKSPAAEAKSLGGFKPDLNAFMGLEAQARESNATTHGLDGQNVLFLDGRVTFETRAYCAVPQPFFSGGGVKDNIYLQSQYPDRSSPIGNVPWIGMQPTNERDSVLVHDPDVFLPSPPWAPRR